MNMNPDQFQQQYPAPGNPYIPSDPYALRVGFGRRLGAVAIDFVIIGILGGIVGSVAGAALFAAFGHSMTAGTETQGMDESIVGFMTILISYALAYSFTSIAYSLVELFTGASPAKHILGIVAAHEDRRQGDIALYAKRWLIRTSPSLVSIISLITGVTVLSWLSNLLALAFLVGCFFVLGEKKQALHDMLAKTAIFHKEDVIEAGSVTAGTTV